MRACSAVSLVLFLTAGTLFVFSDYTRVQILRMRSYLSLQRALNEYQALRSSNKVLRSAVDSLKGERVKAVNQGYDIRQRLEELNHTLRSATTLGVLEEGDIDELDMESTEDIGDVGGAEIDCEGDNCAQSQSFTEDVRMMLKLESAERGEISPKMVPVLDRYVETLSRVPLGIPGTGFINSPYGLRRSPFSGKVKMHQGVDFSLSMGSAVQTTADGIVKSVKRNSTYGLVVDISHGRGVITRYAHLSEVFVKEDQRVCRSQEIGLVGSTGRSTGPHLHYEVRVNNRAKNPMLLIELGHSLRKIL